MHIWTSGNFYDFFAETLQTYLIYFDCPISSNSLIHWVNSCYAFRQKFQNPLKSQSVLNVGPVIIWAMILNPTHNVMFVRAYPRWILWPRNFPPKLRCFRFSNFWCSCLKFIFYKKEVKISWLLDLLLILSCPGQNLQEIF